MKCSTRLISLLLSPSRSPSYAHVQTHHITHFQLICLWWMANGHENNKIKLKKMIQVTFHWCLNLAEMCRMLNDCCSSNSRTNLAQKWMVFFPIYLKSVHILTCVCVCVCVHACVRVFLAPQNDKQDCAVLIPCHFTLIRLRILSACFVCRVRQRQLWQISRNSSRPEDPLWVRQQSSFPSMLCRLFPTPKHTRPTGSCSQWVIHFTQEPLHFFVHWKCPP